MDSAYTPTKITRPQPPPGALLRPRLFAALDATPATPITWVVAPPGAGKTTLLSSYVEQRGGVCLWYQLDRADADPATFFYYLGLAVMRAAPHVERPLPPLTPEYLPGLPVFTRRFFEALYSRLPSPAVLVFDNYQEVDADTPLHTIMQHALAALPPGIQVAILSRSEPPPAFIRLRVEQRMQLLTWNALRLSVDETQQIALAHQVTMPDAALAQLCEQTQGWAAGVTLALAGGGACTAGECGLDAPQAIFDYFAAEIFSDLPQETQQVLLQCAFLPRIDAVQARQLTGSNLADRLLTEFAARGYFTLRHASGDYQLHPLFRAFLLTRATQSFDAVALSDLRRRAAAVLQAAGETDDAVELLIAATAWEPLAHLLAQAAQDMLQQGRGQTLEHWLRALPAGLIAVQPWSLYWLGMCRLPFTPAEARALFEGAYALFVAQADDAGSCLAWCAVVDSFIYEWNDFEPLDRWVAIMDARLALARPFATPEIEARVAYGMFAALLWRQPSHSELPRWAERLLHIVLASDDAALKMALGNNLVFYFVLMGKVANSGIVMEALRSVAAAGNNTPLTQLHWQVTQAMYSWVVADHASCRQAIADGERFAEANGMYLMSANLYAQGVYGAVSQGDSRTAALMLEKMAQMGLPRPMDKGLYHYQAASVYWLQRELVRSRQHSEAALVLLRGAPLAEALARVEYAVTLFELGEADAAYAELEHSADVGRGMNHIQFLVPLYGAYFALMQGRRDPAVASLRLALARGAGEGYVNTPRWSPEIITPLCALALEHAIEPDYVRNLIRHRGLVATDAHAHLEAWPWTIRIHTFGEFAVQVNGQALDLTARDRHRPAELLKVIIALGGRRISVAQLSDILWPTSDGDAAYQSFHTNLHRLRKLLGKDALRSEAGRVSLNESLVWLDTWAMEPLLARMEQHLAGAGNTEALHTDMQTLQRHYRGTLLQEAGEVAWVFNARDGLRERVRRLIDRLGQRYEAEAHWPAALAIYLWGIERVAPTAEVFYLGAMRAHHHLNQPAEVTLVYQRCRAAWQALLGTPPSAAVEKLYTSL